MYSKLLLNLKWSMCSSKSLSRLEDKGPHSLILKMVGHGVVESQGWLVRENENSVSSCGTKSAAVEGQEQGQQLYLGQEQDVQLRKD